MRGKKGGNERELGGDGLVRDYIHADSNRPIDKGRQGWKERHSSWLLASGSQPVSFPLLDTMADPHAITSNAQNLENGNVRVASMLHSRPGRL